MNIKKSVDWYENQEGTCLPAIRILECVFVLEESEKILHLHTEELDIKMVESEARYFKNGTQPLEERARCQVIPPFVNAFRAINLSKTG